jgi:peroxiredoxin
LLLLAFAYKGEENETLKIGDSAPLTQTQMKDISGEMISLEKIKGEKGLLVIFSCNTCPFVIAWEDRYPKLGEICKKENIGMVLINSNEAKRDKDDSFDAMVAHAKEKNYNSYYTMDENSQLANAFGAKTTPHVFLFNSELKLVYKGSIDDNSKDASKVENHFLSDAILNMAGGKKINPNDTKAVGCSIKRVKI